MCNDRIAKLLYVSGGNTMKLQRLSCPNCNASLNMELTKESDYIFCPYCGQQFHIDNEKREYTFNKNININKNINHIKRKIDETEIEKAKVDAKESKYFFLFGALFLILGFGSLGIMALDEKYEAWKAEKVIQEAEQQGKLKIGSPSDFKGQNYESVVAQLKALGFVNIETIDLDDSGLFTKDGSVASISINGDSDFAEEDYFFTTDKIIITYH